MSEKREEVYQILELGKHDKNLHHKKGFGGLLFIDLSMIKFSKLSSYIRQLDKENEELKKQLHDASIQIQELIEKDIWCPSNCEKLEKLQQENKQLKEIIKENTILVKDEYGDYQECNIKPLEMKQKYEKLKDNWNKLKEVIRKKQDYYRYVKDNRYRKFLSELLDKMQEIEGSDNK